MDLDASEDAKTKEEVSGIEPAQASERSALNPEKSVQAELLRRFLQGAGLDDDQIVQSLHPDMFDMIGRVLHTTVQGARDVLMARAEIKNEMRLNVTTLRSAKNNPIKFSLSVEDALNTLLTPQKKGYMPPVRAVEEVFEEDHPSSPDRRVSGHAERAEVYIEAFRSGSAGATPKKTSPLGANIPIHRQAKLWELFEQLYEEIGNEAVDDFGQLFGHAFAKAYEEQILKIKASRARNPID
jgi:type VI secretion system FHA domain protein